MHVSLSPLAQPKNHLKSSKETGRRDFFGVVSLKDKILDKIGAPHEEQLALFYRGNEMRNDQHFCEYRVGMNSEIIATFEFCGENWPFIELDEYDIRDGPRSHCRRSEGTPGGQELPPTR